MKFPITDFFSKCDQICSFQRIWSHLLKKLLKELRNFKGKLFLCPSQKQTKTQQQQYKWVDQDNFKLLYSKTSQPQKNTKRLQANKNKKMLLKNI